MSDALQPDSDLSQASEGPVPLVGQANPLVTPEGSPTKAPPPPVEATPISYRMSGVAAFSSTSPSPHETFERELASETTGRYVGPMPVDKFLATFLPSDEPFLTLSTAQNRLFRNIMSGSSERAMYEPFTGAIEEFTGALDVV
ncbi:hypothetical protein BV22DRAFT_581095, partial [Leucogyrophana mollusca]